MDLMSVNFLLCKKERKWGKRMCRTQIEYGWAWRNLKSSFISLCQFMFQQCSSYSSHIKCPHGNFIICICPWCAAVLNCIFWLPVNFKCEFSAYISISIPASIFHFQWLAHHHNWCYNVYWITSIIVYNVTIKSW